LRDEFARELLGDLAYRSGWLKEVLAEASILLTIERAEWRRGTRQQAEIALSSLNRVSRLSETLATTLMGLYAFVVNRRLGRPQGRIKELWA
jgi:hypothetical protein